MADCPPKYATDGCSDLPQGLPPSIYVRHDLLCHYCCLPTPLRGTWEREISVHRTGQLSFCNESAEEAYFRRI